MRCVAEGGAYIERMPNKGKMPVMPDGPQLQSKQIQIEPAVAEDMDRVIVIDEEITGASKPAFWRKYFEQSASRRTSAFLVARYDGKVVGFIIGTVRAWEFGSPPAGWVHAVLVDAKYRKLGVGSKLLYEIMEYFKSLKVETVRTMLHIDDHSMISFFRFHGLSAGPYIELEMDLDYEKPLTEEAS